MFKSKTADTETAPWTGRRWEYKTVTKLKQDDDALNELGQQGWELVSATHLGGTNVRAFFKRPVEPHQPQH
jgi:Domain of unknown function (DUF4177)